ncbi:MAG: CatB-related O-acetyltransferase [Magnetococcales bacterium]|nr:CatB-related O-acetyltransferase [Magnetococcales bacterium]
MQPAAAAASSWLQQAPEDYHVIETAGEPGEKCFIHKNCLIDGKITMGRCSYINQNSTLGGFYPIHIGSFVSIAQSFYCWTSENHQTGYVATGALRTIVGIPISYPELSRPKREHVKIGNDVWIGSEVRVMPGVEIGDGCVIAARAVVSKDLPPYGVYGGIPARLIRMRFPEQHIKALLAIQWWNWPLAKLLANARFFSTDLTTFAGDLTQLVQEV